jgi:hypothetical protein
MGDIQRCESSQELFLRTTRSTSELAQLRQRDIAKRHQFERAEDDRTYTADRYITNAYKADDQPVIQDVNFRSIVRDPASEAIGHDIADVLVQGAKMWLIDYTRAHVMIGIIIAVVILVAILAANLRARRGQR